MAEHPNDPSNTNENINDLDDSVHDETAQENLTVDQINAMLALEDPEFLEKLTELKELPNESEQIESVEIDSAQLEKELIPSIGFSFSAFFDQQKKNIKSLPKQLKTGAKSFIKFIVVQFVYFGELNLFNKIKVLLIATLLVLSTLVLFKFEDIATGRYWNLIFNNKNFASLEEVADEIYKIDRNQAWEPFSSPSRRPKYYLLLPRVKIRLKNSGPQYSEQYNEPEHLSFATFDIFVEGNSIESGVEIRTKETEILDLVQRLAENYTAEQLLRATNKQKLKSEIRQATNLLLKTGFVQNIYFNSILISP